MDLFKSAMAHYVRLNDGDNALVLGSDVGPKVVPLKNVDLGGLLDSLRTKTDGFVLRHNACDYSVDVTLGEDGAELLDVLPEDVDSGLNQRVEVALGGCTNLELGEIGSVDVSRENPVSVDFSMNGSSESVGFDGLASKTLALGQGALFVSCRDDNYSVQDLNKLGDVPIKSVVVAGVDTQIGDSDEVIRDAEIITTTPKPISKVLPEPREGKWTPYESAWALELKVPGWAIRDNYLSVARKYHHLLPSEQFPLEISIGEETGVIGVKKGVIPSSNAGLIKAVRLGQLTEELAEKVDRTLYPGRNGRKSPIRRFYEENSIENKDPLFLSYIPDKGFRITTEHPTIEVAVQDNDDSDVGVSEKIKDVTWPGGETWTPPEVGYSFTVRIGVSSKRLGPSIKPKCRQYLPKDLPFLLNLTVGDGKKVIAVNTGGSNAVYLRGLPWKNHDATLRCLVDKSLSKAGSTQAFLTEHDPEEIRLVYKGSNPYPLFACLLPGETELADVINSGTTGRGAPADEKMMPKKDELLWPGSYTWDSPTNGASLDVTLSATAAKRRALMVTSEFQTFFPGLRKVVLLDLPSKEGYVTIPAFLDTTGTNYIIKGVLTDIDPSLADYVTSQVMGRISALFKENNFEGGKELRFVFDPLRAGVETIPKYKLVGGIVGDPGNNAGTKGNPDPASGYMADAKVGDTFKTSLDDEDLGTGLVPLPMDLRPNFPGDDGQFVVLADDRSYVANAMSFKEVSKHFVIGRPRVVDASMRRYETSNDQSPNFKGVFIRNELKNGALLELEILSVDPPKYNLTILETERKSSS